LPHNNIPANSLIFRLHQFFQKTVIAYLIRDRPRRLCGEGESCIASAEADTLTKKPTWCPSLWMDLAYIALFEKAVSLEKSANLLESLLWNKSIVLGIKSLPEILY
jgi:hypothetical protein